MGVFRRETHNVPAKETKSHPKLWTQIQELALRSHTACEGAVVGGGIRSFPPATGTPGTLWLLVWLWGRPTTVETYELRSHWTVKLEELTPDWQDSAFIGIYSTEEYLGSQASKDGAQKIDARAKSLPPIKEEADGRNPADPINAHERGVWCPDEPRPSPNDWIPSLDVIPEGEDEETDSFKSARSVADNEELYAAYMVQEQAGGSSSSSAGPNVVLWMSRGSEVFVANDLSKNAENRRNNQVLTKEEESSFFPMVQEAKLKELDNYCAHSAVEAVLAKGTEWNVMTATWVLTFKWTEDGKWKIKARLCLRGFQDRQGSDLHKYSPTASRIAQRLLLIASVMYHWPCVSIDVSAAFLQGLPLEEAKTTTGKARSVWCRPPADVWGILRELQGKYGLTLPVKGYESHWLWKLLKAAYGLDDAPLLWRKAIGDFLLDHGWVESHYDRCMYYKRAGNDKRGRLVGVLTLHIDDEVAAGAEPMLSSLRTAMEARFGECKFQKDNFRHIGHEYSQTWSGEETTITDSQ